MDMTNQDYECAAAASAAGDDTRQIRAVPTATLRQRAARPRFSALDSARGTLMPTLQSGLERYILAVASEISAGPERVASLVAETAT